MSQQTRRAIAFIGGGCLLAGAIGFGVWQVSDPANFSNASQVYEAGHTQTETATITETTRASESSARASTSTRDTAGQNANENSAATQENSRQHNTRHRSAPHSLADAHGLPTTPRESQSSRRTQIDAADPFLPPHAVIQADPKPVEPTVVYRPRGFEDPQPQQQGSQRGARNQEPNDSLVIAEPAPGTDRHSDTSADSTGPGATPSGGTDPNTANQGAARNGASGQVGIQQAPVEVPQAIQDLTTLDPKPLLNETLDRAGLQPGAGKPAQAGQPRDAGEPNDTSTQDQQVQRFHQNEQAPEAEAGTAAETGQTANAPTSAELHDALARGTAAANEAAQTVREAVDEFVGTEVTGTDSTDVGSAALSSSSSAFRAR